ncbi:MAG: sigma-54-dependent Fis family transcriptional regulator, partial [Sphingomonadales bacterium]|nr:sigma-54-dependent Fis family transcriptional regulator [Sphingomonadales bacterium]
MVMSDAGNNVGDGDILLVEDSFSLASIYRLQLEKAGFRVTNAETWAEAKTELDTRHYRLVFLDMHLPDGDGLDLLRDIHNRGLNTAVVVVTADGSITRVVDAMRFGAYDFLVKPFSERRLVTTARNALERVNLQTAISTIQNELGRDHFHGFIGKSVPMQSIYRAIENVAKSKASVFITG